MAKYKCVHLKSKNRWTSSACGSRIYNNVRERITSKIENVTCPLCVKTHEYRNKAGSSGLVKVDAKLQNREYYVVKSNKVLFSGSMDEVENWVDSHGQYVASEYTFLVKSGNEYTANWKLILEKK